MLSLDTLVAGYGPGDVLKGISLRVGAQEIVTLLGANGAGKSTTLMAICGFVKARGGSVNFLGHDITHMPVQERVALGLVQSPEGRRVFARMSVAENLAMGAYLRHDRDGIKGDLERMYDMFPILRDRRSQLAGTLSGGEQQMLAMGRAVMARPKMLLLDEPSLGLAPLIIAQIFEVVQALHASGISILLVEQNAAQALKVASRGYVMDMGRLTMEADSATLLDDPRVRQAYLGES